MAWISESLQQDILADAERVGVSSQEIKKIKQALKTNGVTYTHNHHGAILGITTARGLEFRWNFHYDNPPKNVTLTKRFVFDVIGESDGQVYNHPESARRAGMNWAQSKYSEFAQIGRYGDIYVPTQDGKGTIFIGGVSVIEA